MGYDNIDHLFEKTSKIRLHEIDISKYLKFLGYLDLNRISGTHNQPPLLTSLFEMDKYTQ